jgi:catechol 2,3-dioxygenase-like lactoylglutathione lyase family enzyme
MIDMNSTRGFTVATMELSDGVWPDRLPAVEVRIARPTDKLGEVLDFYCKDLGLPELYRTASHGYRVVMVGLPGDKYHLEFTSHVDGSPGRAPTDENLLVFYFATADEMFDVVTRLGESGHEPVELDNPWWRENGALAFADPDNWRIVLMPNPIPLAS